MLWGLLAGAEACCCSVCAWASGRRERWAEVGWIGGWGVDLGVRVRPVFAGSSVEMRGVGRGGRRGVGESGRRG